MGLCSSRARALPIFGPSPKFTQQFSPGCSTDLVGFHHGYKGDQPTSCPSYNYDVAVGED